MATMQALLFPVTRAGFFLAGEAASSSSASHPYRFSWRPLSSRHASNFPRPISQSPFLFIAFHSLSSRSSLFSGKYGALRLRETKHSLAARASSSPISSSLTSSSDDAEKAKLAQVAKKLENTSRSFQRLGSFGFWGQLVCIVVAAVILSFSVVVTGKITSPATFYATATSITAGFISVFWSFGYIRLSERLQRTAKEPSKAPPRADVVKSLKNGIILNLVGMGAAVLGMQATVGLLVAKALTSSAVPYYQGTSSGYSPVLALDVFLVQASANTILSFPGTCLLVGVTALSDHNFTRNGSYTQNGMISDLLPG